jgi:hypothetical protein
MNISFYFYRPYDFKLILLKSKSFSLLIVIFFIKNKENQQIEIFIYNFKKLNRNI